MGYENIKGTDDINRFMFKLLKHSCPGIPSHTKYKAMHPL